MKHTKRFLIVVSFLLVFLSAVAFAQLPVPRAALEHAIAIQERYTDDLMADPDVVGTGVGVGANGQAVIKVFVKRGQLVGLRGTLDGVPVVTQVTGEIVALKGGRPDGVGGGGGGGDVEVDPTARFDRPVPIGVSTGHPDITAGTIGARVVQEDDEGAKFYFALSNNHVYADENCGGTNTIICIDDAVIQPGTFDGGLERAEDGTDKDVIGTLAAFVVIDFCSELSPGVYDCTNVNTVDAAIASTTTDLLGIATPSDGYGIPISETIPAAVGMRVMKYGRTTGQTKGRIDSINVTINVGYDSGVARFEHQIFITPGNFSAGGDSGSLIVVQKGSDARKPVGLLFAGSIFGSFANPIDAVLTELGVTIDDTDNTEE